MNIIDTKLFYKEYIKRVNENTIDESSGIKYLELYKSNKDFTKIVIPAIEDVIKSCDKSVSTSREYFRLDVSGWISKYEEMADDAKAYGVNIKPHFWDLVIAVEHENSLTDWSDEIVKLAHIKCPLKVLITYNHCDRRDEDFAKLFFVTKWLKKVRAFEVGDEDYLVIIGNAYNSKTKKSDYTGFGYKGYIFDRKSNRFESLVVD